jgi:alpha-tubulin suppressor-like RCC1 family protein
MRTLALCGLACTSIALTGCEWLIGIEPVTLFPDAAPAGPSDGPAIPIDAPPDAASKTVQQLSLGGGHTCVLWSTGRISCWGTNTHGQLGYGHLDPIGDDEPIAPLAEITLGGTAQSMSSDAEFNCALMSTNAVRCWGSNVYEGGCDATVRSGQLGHPGETCIGDDELPSTPGNVQIGGPALRVATGSYHTCAQLSAEGIRCWGLGTAGQLGYGETRNIERPGTAGLVPVTLTGESVRTIVAGVDHTCILLESGQVRCWGSAQYGQLGYGNTEWIGDDEPAQAVDVALGGVATQLVAGAYHNCALLETGEVRCWGRGDNGRLGLGPITLSSDTANIGDDELPTDAPPVDVGGEVLAMTAGFSHTCVLLVGGNVRCWGQGDHGQLGHHGTNDIGAAETPATIATVDIGASIEQIATGFAHTCALASTGQVFCWGFNGRGQLGYGDTEDVGDDEHPREAGAVPLSSAAL